MIKRRPSNLADAGLIRRRHRRLRIGPARTTSKRRARRMLIAGAAALVAAVTVLGYATEEPYVAPPLPAAQIPLGSEGAEFPAGTDSSSAGEAGEAGAAPSSSPPAPSGSAPPAATPQPVPSSTPPGQPAPPAPTTPPPGATTPPATTTPPPPAATPPPAASPRLVGPASLDGFDNFLDGFCEKGGFRGALLLNGRRTPTTGRWVCTRFTKIDTIDLDDACQDSFGGQARARAQVDGDIRTVRCFDS